MTTARAKLHADLVDLVQGVGKPLDDKILAEVLSGYRIQFKSKQAGDDSAITAREQLCREIEAAAKRPPKDVVGWLATLLDSYRMQLKQGEARPTKKATAPKPAKGVETRPTPERAPSPPPSPAPTPAATRPKSAPVAAKTVSPLRPEEPADARRSTRTECPKCHSMGVVLARSYATDEYYSCIYCGWQGFKSPEALEAEDSLAARLLGIYTGAAQTDEPDGD